MRSGAQSNPPQRFCARSDGNSLCARSGKERERCKVGNAILFSGLQQLSGGEGNPVLQPLQFGDNIKDAWPDWTVLPAAKVLSLKGLNAASQAIGNTEFLSVTGGASTTLLSPTAASIHVGEKLAGRLAGPAVALATGLDVIANAGCGTIGRQAAGQMTPLPSGAEVVF